MTLTVHAAEDLAELLEEMVGHLRRDAIAKLMVVWVHESARVVVAFRESEVTPLPGAPDGDPTPPLGHRRRAR